MQPCDERQQSILDGDIKKFVLCQENMDYLPVLQQEVNKQMHCKSNRQATLAATIETKLIVSVPHAASAPVTPL